MNAPAVSPKVAAAGGTGAAVVVLVWVLHLAGVDVPAPVQAALVVILPAVAGWFTRDRLRDLGAIVHHNGDDPDYAPKHAAD